MHSPLNNAMQGGKTSPFTRGKDTQMSNDLALAMDDWKAVNALVSELPPDAGYELRGYADDRPNRWRVLVHYEFDNTHLMVTDHSLQYACERMRGEVEKRKSPK